MFRNRTGSLFQNIRCNAVQSAIKVFRIHFCDIYRKFFKEKYHRTGNTLQGLNALTTVIQVLLQGFGRSSGGRVAFK
jgi:hypothetical protein